MLIFGAGIWRKLIFICVISFCIFFILLERSNTTQVINNVNEEAQACRRQVESLVTQLTVINTHRKKLDEILTKKKIETNSIIEEMKNKLLLKNNEYSELEKKYNLCFKTGDFINNSNGLKNLNENESISQLKTENEQQKKEIMALREELNNLKKKLSTVDETNIENKNEELKQLHPEEEHKGYADGDTVHFHRKVPNSANLEFKRVNDLMPIPQILSQNDLMKKIQEQKKIKEMKQVANDGGEIDENVFDYRQNKKVNEDEKDYKEMG